MRGELERLMADLRVATLEQHDSKDGDGVDASGGGKLKSMLSSMLCPIPAGVPNLPAGIRVTEEMEQLRVALNDSKAHSQVGFCGMGGIGKTVVSTWLVRSNDVRKTYQQMAWVTFGMSPVIEKCQRGLYMQLVGREMNRDMSQDEIRQSLKLAFVGKNVLLVLDDVWEREHANEFIFIDDNTNSTVLISSRVRGVLEGGKIVDIGLPSDADAIQILLNEAGFQTTPEHAPPEAAEVVKFCNNLPLAIGIAGGLLKNMSLGDDWSGVVAVLREEFGEGGQARSMENSVIRTSLKGVKGSQQEEVVQLFLSFALVPEDTMCPLDVIGMLFSAAGAAFGSKPKFQRVPARLLLRKWLYACSFRTSLFCPKIDVARRRERNPRMLP
jgi:hypothetical protein